MKGLKKEKIQHQNNKIFIQPWNLRETCGNLHQSHYKIKTQSLMDTVRGQGGIPHWSLAVPVHVRKFPRSNAQRMDLEKNQLIGL